LERNVACQFRRYGWNHPDEFGVSTCGVSFWAATLK
jgi:hypothetical protein